MLAQDSLNLAWDATSLDAEHVNEVHLNFSSDESLVLQVDVLPGGTTTDYTNHICQSFTDITQTYSAYGGDDFVPLHKSVVGKLTSSISDRVVVNHCVNVALETKLGIELHELKCNVHPLDGLASQTRKTCQQIDKSSGFKGSLFGREGAVVNVIYSLSKMRYKNGRGDPKGFKSFLMQNKIAAKMIPRYVGNRMHILFHLAGTFYSLREKLLTYLTDYCNCNSGLKTGLIKDLSNPLIQIQLKAIGILGKLLTGPWMTIMYGNKDKMSNLEAVPHLKKCVDTVRYFKEHPESVLGTTLTEDMFGQRLCYDEDPILTELMQQITDEAQSKVFNDILKQLLEGIVTVLERQLQPYLVGELSAPTDDMIQKTKSAPVHNIVSERVLGMTDHQYHRAPNATMGFIDGKVRSAKNKTLDWLNSKSSEEQERIITFSINRARQVRAIKKQRLDHMNKVYHERQKEKNQEKDKAFRTKVEKKMKSLVLNPTLDLATELAQSGVKETPDAMLQMIRTVLDNPEVLKDRAIDHFWYDEGTNIQYHGKILEVQGQKRSSKNPKPPTLTIEYWAMDEQEDDSEDFKMSLPEILTDYILKDLFFVDVE